MFSDLRVGSLELALSSSCLDIRCPVPPESLGLVHRSWNAYGPVRILTDLFISHQLIQVAAQLGAMRDENRRMWDQLSGERRKVEKLVNVVTRLWDVVGKGFPGTSGFFALLLFPEIDDALFHSAAVSTRSLGAHRESKYLYHLTNIEYTSLSPSFIDELGLSATTLITLLEQSELKPHGR